MEIEQPSKHRCGIVAVAGRPNVGKSTLVNRILGQELCIVTHKPQTTRNRITAIHTMPDAQLILQDTPGIHEAGTPLNRSLVAAAIKTVEEADIVLMITTPSEAVPDDDRRIIDLVQSSTTDSVLAINKIDTLPPAALLPIIDEFSQAHTFREIVPVCALSGSGVDELVHVLVRLLPEGPALFPEEDVSDLPLRFFAGEAIREQIIVMTGEEIPYKTAVAVETFKERKGSILIQADIHVERASQKKILIGKGGAMIKKIGIAARKKLEDFLESPVHLDLFVKVSPHWTRNEGRLREFGY